jgi:hypothetical protein
MPEALWPPDSSLATTHGPDAATALRLLAACWPRAGSRPITITERRRRMGKRIVRPRPVAKQPASRKLGAGSVGA